MKVAPEIKAHAGLFLAMVVFGLMAPFSKDAMNSGVTGLQLATFRICGAAVLFWMATLVTPQQHVPKRDLLRIAAASIFGIVLAQGGLVVGLSLTSPINATMEITTQPIFALLLAALILHERITARKATGVLLGFIGAVILVLLNTSNNGKAADIHGDLIVFVSQISFALYLTIFSDIIKKYDLFTFNKWMFTFASIIILPLTYADMRQLQWSALTPRTISEIAYIIVFCTFITFLLVVYSQRKLSSTVVSTYNYVQPFVTVTASLLMGLAVFQWQHLLAAILIFTGVWLVISARQKV